MLEADLASAVRRAFTGTLNEARMKLFHPLGFMLASPVDTPEEAVARFTPQPPERASKQENSPAKTHQEDPDQIRVHPRSSVV